MAKRTTIITIMEMLLPAGAACAWRRVVNMFLGVGVKIRIVLVSRGKKEHGVWRVQAPGFKAIGDLTPLGLRDDPFISPFLLLSCPPFGILRRCRWLWRL